MEKIPVIFLTSLFLLGIGCSDYSNRKHYTDGVLAKQRGTFKHATREFKKVEETHPLFESAEEELEIISSILQEIDINQSCAEKAFDSKRWSRAIKCYKVVYEYHPWDTKARNRIEEAKKELGAVARRGSKARRAKDAKAFEEDMRNASTYENNGKFIQAYLAYSSAEKSAPKATLSSDARNKKMSIENSARDQATIKMNEGKALLSQGKYQKAIDSLKSILNFTPIGSKVRKALSKAYEKLARQYNKKQDYINAEKYFLKSYSYAPSNSNLKTMAERMKNLAKSTGGD